MPSTEAVSDGTKQAVAIARALGGYPSSLNVNAAGRAGYAGIVLRIPKQNVQRAVARLSALGTIIGENVSIQDIQAQVDASARKLARLRARLAAWQEQPQTTETQAHIAALTDQIGKLGRGRAATIRTASYATVAVQLHDPAGPGGRAPRPTARCTGSPSRSAGLGIGAVYAARARHAPAPPGRPHLARGPRRSPAPRERAAQPLLSVASSSSSLIWAKTRNVGSPTGSSPNSGLTQPVSSEREA